MPMTGVQKVQAFRGREKLKKAERQRLALVILDDLLADSPITIKVERTAYSIDFVWGGEQSDYDDIEAVCNSAGFSFAHVQADLEALMLKRLKHRGK